METTVQVINFDCPINFCQVPFETARILIDKYDDTELSWGWIKDEKEYYAISIYSEIEDDTFLKIRHPKTYEVKAGEKADECGEIITHKGCDCPLQFDWVARFAHQHHF